MKRRSYLCISIFLCLILFGCTQDVSEKILNLEISKCKASDFVKNIQYKDISVPEGYTYLSQYDIENIISWDLNSDEQFVRIDSRNNVQNEDIIHLLVLYDNSDKLEFYYEVGSEDIFKNTDVFDGCKVGQEIKTQISLQETVKEARVKILGIYRYPTIKDEELVLEYYGYKNMEEVVEFIKERAKKQIIFYYKWENILKKVEIDKYPDFVEKTLEELMCEYKKGKMDLYDYEKEQNEIYLFYDELLIAKAILENEGIIVDKKEMEKHIINKCNKLQIDKEDILSYFDKESIYKDLLMDKIKNILS